MAETDDRQLLKDCLDGKTGAWEALIARHGPVMQDAAALRLGNAPDAEEVCQRVFARLSADGGRVLGTFRGACALRTWLVVLALNEATNYAKGEERLRHHLQRRHIRPESLPTPLQVLCQTEDVARVRAALQRLPARDRLLLTLIHWDGLTHADAAQLARVPAHSVPHFLNAALDRLRHCLEAG